MPPDDDERSPLLSSPRPDVADEESDPLLGPRSDEQAEDNDNTNTTATRWLAWLRKPKSASRSSVGSGGSRRWPSIIAMVVLALLVIVVIILGFVIPPAVQQYAERSLVLEPTNLSLESLTSDGVRARIKANLRLDGSRVKDGNTRRIGKFVTGIMRKLESKPTEVQIYLPTYDNALLGTAVVPSIVVDIRNGHDNEMDFVADLIPVEPENIRMIVNQWLDGYLDRLSVTGSTSLQLKSGIFPLGTHDVKQSLVIEADEIPSMPNYDIENLHFRDVPVGDHGNKAIGADVSVTAYNRYPISAEVPTLAFEILVPNCDPSDKKISIAEAVTNVVNIRPKANVTAVAKGIISELPESLTRACPSTELSPLDTFVKHYLHGDKIEFFVRGKKQQREGTPSWIGDIISSVTIPVEYSSNPFNDFIRNFSLTDVSFKLPSPFADPKDPDGQPRVSGTISVLGALPAGFDIFVNVGAVKAAADLFYKGDKLGELNLQDWQKSNSTRIVGPIDNEDLLNVTSHVDDAPIDITDGDVFSDLMSEMLFGDDDIILDVDSAVDAKVSTVLGSVDLKGIPAKGKIPVKPLSGDIFKDLQPQVSDIRILNTSDTGIYMEITANLTNPTPYTATAPYVNVHILEEGHIVGECIARDVDVRRGKNDNLLIHATWDPARLGGEQAREIGRRTLSDYISGKNTTLTVQTHKGTIPSVPLIGDALSKINLTIPAPRLKLPGSDEDEDGSEHRFIQAATFHIFSSTASFVLASPLRHNTLYIESINATALWNHTEPVGRIIHNEAFPVTPGLSTTPKLPVQWSASSIGFEKMRDALGGELKLDAFANVSIKMGNWREKIDYEGHGIGAHIRL